MAIRSIRRQATNPLAAPGTTATAPIYVDSDDNKLKMIPAGSGTTEIDIVDVSSTQTLTNKTLTSPTITAPITTTALVAGGATLTLTAAAHAGKTIAWDTAAGTIVTLPAATGTGNVYKFVITVVATTNSHIVKVANANDTMVGVALAVSDDAGNTVKPFFAATTDDTITLNRTTTGSTRVGEFFEVRDIATNLFMVYGVTAATGTEATPFSATV